MHKDLQLIREVSKGLLFTSESDFPFEIVEFKSDDIEKEIRQLTQKSQAQQIEIQTVDYFFRNTVKTYPGYTEQQQATALQFLKLKELIIQKLKDAKVYRIGTIQVDVFIVGKIQDGSFGGLRTRVIET